MCSTFTPDSRYDNSIIKLIGNVHCPNEMCSGELCAHKETFQSLGRSDYQCPQGTFTCQVRNFHFEEQTNSIFFKCDKGIYIFEETQKSIQDINGDVYCPGRNCLQQKRVYVHTWTENDESCYE